MSIFEYRRFTAATAPEPMNFGDIIEALQAGLKEFPEHEGYITFDWGGCWPTGFDSYRGYYEHLCLEYSGSYSDNLYAKDFLKICSEYLDRPSQEGWKGGTYPIHSGQEVWVACSGMTSETRVLAVVFTDWNAIIKTMHQAD